MLKITIPNSFLPERRYIIETIFSDFLGLDFKLFEHELEEYHIQGDDLEKTVIIKSSFWNIGTESYLAESNIPQKVNVLEAAAYTTEIDLPYFYGTSELAEYETIIRIGADVFASGFLLLSRWEEYVLQEKDRHGRFPDELNTLVRFNLHHRPLVNEYTEFLWNILSALGCKQKRKELDYRIKFTHDIDWFLAYPNFKRFIRKIGGSLIKRKSLKEFLQVIKVYSGLKLGFCKDPYDTFNDLMDLAEKHGSTSTFNFIPGMRGEADADYNITDSAVIDTIRHIQSRGHKIGLHASYDSYNNSEVFIRDLDRLRRIVPDISEGRQHFLRFQNPDTWQLWAASGLKTDSTMGFSNHVGFRCGTSYRFPMFDILNRNRLNLYEHPLIIMDTVFYNNSTTKKEAEALVQQLNFAVQKYGGIFVILIHNNIAMKYIEIFNSM